MLQNNEDRAIGAMNRKKKEKRSRKDAIREGEASCDGAR
jgi:hypothetical protein